MNMPSEKRAKNTAERKHVPHTGGGQNVRAESAKQLQRQKSQAQAEVPKEKAEELERERRKGKKNPAEKQEPSARRS